MKSSKPSGSAIFMYVTMILTSVIALVCFCIYYTGSVNSQVVLWCGIVSFMILYHFGLRIYMGRVTKRIHIDYKAPFFRQRSFEMSLYKLLKVRRWKDKVLTFEPEMYDFKNRTLEQLAATMAKSETDHWINEIISIISIFFTFIWGCFPAFFISALAAMLFDAQFIIVQRYNRPIVLRVIERKNQSSCAG